VIDPAALTGSEIPSIWHQTWTMLRWSNPLGFVFTTIIGASFGSFANVVIHRIPSKMSLLKPASHCPNCHKPIPPYHNIPIISYFILRGRSACCDEPISPQYPIVELLSALMLGSLYLLNGWTIDFLFQSGWMILLLILAVIDLEHYRLPNSLVLSGVILSILWMIFSPDQSWLDAVFGLVTGFGLAGFAMLFGRIFKGEWSGVGDLKLAMALGFTFGPARFFFLYLVSSIAAILYFIVRRGKTKERRVPMGPFFAVGTWITIWGGAEVVRWYLGFF